MKLDTLPNKYVVFDIETTGYMPTNSEILEIGALKCDNGKVEKTFHTYISPMSEYVPPMITRLTGITYDMVRDSPGFEDALPPFLDFIGDLPVVGHNVNFDIRFVTRYCKNCFLEFDCDYVDTLPLARKVIKDIENHKLSTIKEYFNINLPSHNAIDDCKVTQYLYEYCKKRI